MPLPVGKGKAEDAGRRRPDVPSGGAWLRNQLAGEIHAEQDGAAVPAELAAAVRACDAGSS